MAWPGGKSGNGVFQAIINQIRPHDLYIEPFAGDAAVFRHKTRSARSVLCDLDGRSIQRLEQLDADVRQCCGLDFLRHTFNVWPGSVPGSDAYSGGLVPRTVVYCDPPYVRSARRSAGDIYRHEWTDSQHVELINTLKRLPDHVDVILSGYDSPLYREALQTWRTVTFQAMNRAGQRTTEVLWMNYPEPAALHDYRHLGRNRRDRERIRRRQRTVIRTLASLPQLERQAMVAAILATVGGSNDGRCISEVGTDRKRHQADTLEGDQLSGLPVTGRRQHVPTSD